MPSRRYTRAAVKTVRDGAAAGEGAAAQENMLVIMGEKGRSQLQRDMRDSIFATIAGARFWCWQAGSRPPLLVMPLAACSGRRLWIMAFDHAKQLAAC